MQFAAMVVNIHDVILTFDDEVEFVWSRPWKVATLLYLCNRYFVLIESVLNVVGWLDSWLAPGPCVSLNVLSAVWAPPVVITLVEALLVLRVCTLFCNQRPIVIGLSALLFSSTFISLVFSVLMTPAIRYLASPLPPLYGCQYYNSIGAEMLQTWIWIPSIVVEIVLVSLTVFKTIQHLKRATGVKSALAIILRE